MTAIGFDVGLASEYILSMKVPGKRISRSPEYRQAVHEFSRSLTLIVDEEQLRETIPAKLREFFGVERVAVFLREADGGPFVLSSARGLGEELDSSLAFLPNGRLARWLKVNEEPLVLSDQPGVVDFLGDAEREILARLDIHACFPLVALNQLKGFLALGSTAGSNAFTLSGEQRELLTVFAGQTALAFENAALLREQRARLKRLYRAERLATAGELAAGAAHEIRNPLASIRSAIQHLRGSFSEGDKQTDLVDDILAEVDRINDIVEGLLSFARPAEPQFGRVNLAELARHVVTLVEVQAGEQNVVASVDVPDIVVRADPNLITQVLLNVVMNALQAMPDGGALDIATISTGRTVEIRVSDTGAGIAMEDREKLFDPFFTTKKGGTGLGLSVCYGIVQRHGGEIEVESDVGHGTVVMIRLPEGHGS
jgi:signal transduction histidine kinase